MKRQLFRGVGTALVTPFTAQGALDLETLKKLIEHQIDQGADALILCGTTGESSVLTDAEKRSIFQLAVRMCKGKIPMIAGVGSNDTQHTVLLAKMAQQCGADGLLVVTPYYNKTTQQGAIQHYSAVIKATDLPVILYNVPSRTGFDLQTDTVVYLSKLPQIVGIKEAGGNIEKITKLRIETSSDFALYTGNDAELLSVLALGGDGVISVTSNLLPNVVHCICTAFWSGNVELARNLQWRLTPLNTLLFEKVNPIPVKVLMEAIGLSCGPCRLPLEQLTPEQRADLLQRGTPLIRQNFQIG